MTYVSEAGSVQSGFFQDWTSKALSVADIMIIGGGISGALAATVLAKAGHSVRLVDRHSEYPPDFRAEHLDGVAVDQLYRLGFLTDLTTGLFRGDTVSIARSGRVIARARTINYGLRYETLVNRARSALPRSVDIVTQRVKSISTSNDIQQVHTADGRILQSRLLILATGQGMALCRQAGISRRTIRPAHSLTFGFDIESTKREGFEHSFLVYQRERIADRIDYFAAFTMGSSTRVNLFTYRDYAEPWTKRFINDASTELAAVLPGLQSVTGPFRVTSPVVVRPVDLYASDNIKQPGVVLIGDALQSSCPATGMGMVKLLTDVERLCTIHVPAWLKTPGMDVAKIAQFYDDPVKQACDSKALHDAQYRRAVSTKTGLAWDLHRMRVGLMTRYQGWRNRVDPSSHPRIGPALPPPSPIEVQTVNPGRQAVGAETAAHALSETVSP